MKNIFMICFCLLMTAAVFTAAAGVNGPGVTLGTIPAVDESVCPVETAQAVGGAGVQLLMCNWIVGEGVLPKEVIPLWGAKRVTGLNMV